MSISNKQPNLGHFPSLALAHPVGLRRKLGNTPMDIISILMNGILLLWLIPVNLLGVLVVGCIVYFVSRQSPTLKQKLAVRTGEMLIIWMLIDLWMKTGADREGGFAAVGNVMGLILFTIIIFITLSIQVIVLVYRHNHENRPMCK